MDRRSVREMTEISHTELWAGLSVSARAAGQSPSCDLSTAVRINEQRRRSAPFPLFSHPEHTLAQPCMAKNSGALVFPALYLSELGQRDIPRGRFQNDLLLRFRPLQRFQIDLYLLYGGCVMDYWQPYFPHTTRNPVRSEEKINIEVISLHKWQHLLEGKNACCACILCIRVKDSSFYTKTIRAQTFYMITQLWVLGGNRITFFFLLSKQK